MADIKNIDVFQTVTSVSFEVEPNTNVININKITTSGYTGVPNLQEVTNQGATTTNPITANSFVKSGGTSTQFLMADGSVSTGSEGSGIPHTTASGTDTYTATVSGVASYADGDIYLVRFPIGNTTGCTLNINALGAIPLYRNNDGALIGGDIQNSGEMLCVYDSVSAVFRCIGTSPNSIIAYVTNADSVTITKGQAVYAFGGQGDRMTVKRAFNISDATSGQTIGIVMSTSIATNQRGIIMMQGLLDGLSTLPTGTYADGDTIYLGATAGTITNVKPHAPNHLVYLGVVTTASNGASGRMYVKVQNGYELDELHNVQAQNPTLKDTLWYDNTVTPAQWKTASIPTILGYTPANDANVVHLTGEENITGVKYFTNGVRVGTNTQFFEYFGYPYITSDNGKTITIGNGPGLSQNNLSVANGTFNIELQTANTIASFDASKNVVSLPIATYPSLNELSYVKGVTSAIQNQLNGKVSTNIAITGATKTKITYDSKGLVTSGADATTADIADSTNKRYVTDANLTVIGNTSGTNTGDNATNTQYSGLATSKQDTLQSTVNIKSINGNSLLGSGDLTISASAAAQSAYTILANNTNASAVPTEQPFENITNATYDGATPTWTGTTAPSGTTQHTYSLSQVGNLVTLTINLSYATAGLSLTSVSCELPSTAPTPALPTSVSVAGEIISYAIGWLTTNKTIAATNFPVCAFRLKSTSPNVFEVVVVRSPASSYRYAYITLQYFV